MKLSLNELRNMIREELTSKQDNKQITYTEMLQLINNLELPKKRFEAILKMLKDQYS